MVTRGHDVTCYNDGAVGRLQQWRRWRQINSHRPLCLLKQRGRKQHTPSTDSQMVCASYKSHVQPNTSMKSGAQKLSFLLFLMPPTAEEKCATKPPLKHAEGTSVCALRNQKGENMWKETIKWVVSETFWITDNQWSNTRTFTKAQNHCFIETCHLITNTHEIFTWKGTRPFISDKATLVTWSTRNCQRCDGSKRSDTILLSGDPQNLSNGLEMGVELMRGVGWEWRPIRLLLVWAKRGLKSFHVNHHAKIQHPTSCR